MMKYPRSKVRKLMDDLHPTSFEFKISNPRTQASKKRGVTQRVVVAVKIEQNDKKQKIEGAPSDCWSWRKYGQKTIKGSPYPRGYYKCSTSKGCSAKKQVEKCRTDASMLIITYTSTHNHPGPDLSSINQKEKLKEDLVPILTDVHPTTPQQEQEANLKQQETLAITDGDHFRDVQSQGHSSQVVPVDQEKNPFKENLETPSLPSHVEVPEAYFHSTNLSATKTEENDFYDELEELPTSSYITTFIREEFLEERILVNPS